MTDENQQPDEVQIEDILSKIDYDMKMKDFKDKNIIFEYYSPVRKKKKKIPNSSKQFLIKVGKTM